MARAESGFSWIPNFTRWRQSSSVVAGNYLILDGGELANKPGGVKDAQTHYMASTIVVDLRESWTNATLKQYGIIDKPRTFPFARQPFLWYNPLSGTVQAIGGMKYSDTEGWFVRKQQERNNRKVLPATTLWDFVLPGTGNSGQLSQPWSKEDAGPFKAASGESSILNMASAVATTDAFYALGGIDDHYNISPRLLEYDFASAHLSNTTSDYGPHGFGADNQVIYSSLWGEKGVLIFIGGYSPMRGQLQYSSTNGLQDMMKIRIYDIAADVFLNQSATLDHQSRKPSRRWGFCAVGASEAGSSILDIFMHGGLSGTENDALYNPSLANVYVLSIPSFVWTEIPRSIATMRGLHSCQLIGQRQMAVLGGDNPEAHVLGNIPDPWTNGIGVFDLSEWRWSSKYDALAKPYQRAPKLVEMSAQQFYPDTWDSNYVQTLFTKNTPSTSSPPTNNNNDHGGSGDSTDTQGNSGGSGDSNAGAIAGGVVGGLVALALIALAIFYFVRKRRRNRSYGMRDAKDTPSSSTPHSVPPTLSEKGEVAEPASEHPVGRVEKPPELESSTVAKQELDTSTAKVELESPFPSTEMDTPTTAVESQSAPLFEPHSTSLYEPHSTELHEIGTSDTSHPKWI